MRVLRQTTTTKGFEDTSGAEVDVVNGIGTVQALQKASSVRVIVVIPYSSLQENRMQSVKHLVHNLARMMPEYEDYMDCFTCVYTKVQNVENVGDLPQWIEQGTKEMKDGDTDEVIGMCYTLKSSFCSLCFVCCVLTQTG